MRRARHGPIGTFASAIVSLLAMSGPAIAQRCATGAEAPNGIVKGVSDSRTLTLADGRAVRLHGVDVPTSAETAARAFLATVIDRTVVLRTESAAIDRYQRILAFVFPARVGPAGNNLEASIQHDMVKGGLARVSVRAGDRACASELLALEVAARTRRLGLWADTAHAVRSADDPAAVLRLRGTMGLVEGRVLSVRESGGTIYLNFGRRWSEDFTATVAKRNERVFAAAGVDLKRLERRTVRLRGWIEERGGPWIDLTDPGQIETVGN